MRSSDDFHPSASLQFVDVLIGAMASLLLLFLNQVATIPPPSAGDSSDSLIRISIPDEGNASVDVKGYIDGQLIDFSEVESKNGIRKGVTAGVTNQAVLLVDSNSYFRDEDFLVIFVRDWGRKARSQPQNIQIQLVLKGETKQLDSDNNQALQLRIDNPRLNVSLNSLIEDSPKLITKGLVR